MSWPKRSSSASLPVWTGPRAPRRLPRILCLPALRLDPRRTRCPAPEGTRSRPPPPATGPGAPGFAPLSLQVATECVEICPDLRALTPIRARSSAVPRYIHRSRLLQSVRSPLGSRDAERAGTRAPGGQAGGAGCPADPRRARRHPPPARRTAQVRDGAARGARGDAHGPRRGGPLPRDLDGAGESRRRSATRPSWTSPSVAPRTSRRWPAS